MAAPLTSATRGSVEPSRHRSSVAGRSQPPPRVARARVPSGSQPIGVTASSCGADLGGLHRIAGPDERFHARLAVALGEGERRFLRELRDDDVVDEKLRLMQGSQSLLDLLLGRSGRPLLRQLERMEVEPILVLRGVVQRAPVLGEGQREDAVRILGDGQEARLGPPVGGEEQAVLTRSALADHDHARAGGVVLDLVVPRQERDVLGRPTLHRQLEELTPVSRRCRPLRFRWDGTAPGTWTRGRLARGPPALPW